MNKQFMIKMLQAKKLQYEAFKEIMPEAMVDRISTLENELFEVAKEYFMSHSSENGNSRQKDNSDKKSKARKINID